jgi:hypothetical protein
MSKTKSFVLILGVLIMSFLVGYLVLAWDEPTAAPPGANVDAPLNVDPDAQTKTGGLTIGTDGTGITAPISYDLDTTYYVDPANIGYSANFQGNIRIPTYKRFLASPLVMLHMQSSTEGGIYYNTYYDGGWNSIDTTKRGQLIQFGTDSIDFWFTQTAGGSDWQRRFFMDYTGRTYFTGNVGMSHSLPTLKSRHWAKDPADIG